MNQLNIAITAIAALVVAVGLLSKPLRRMYFSDSTIALLLGILMSPHVLGWLDITGWWGNHQVWVVSSLLIFASILAHSISATPLSQLYGSLQMTND